ncbi:MAG: Unknown protein [uncultured Thiotrichaceae bacterium]|uniref:Uncharacterized protein n=1 Tax=uncultured Thiotrichaceae bacterium TaxID=298394 RepID=A0A6S6S2S7_9GAMM|nr:MAG: Unknown protein [uncultured Thiotrichaceae bacterium]
MKIKTQLTLASVIAAGLLASGCSQQMVAQQAVAEVAPAPEVKTVVDCSSCNKPAPVAPKPVMRGNMHAHPAIPNCTDSVKHNHPHPNGGRHTHAYSCKKAAPAPRPAPMPAPAPAPAPRPVVNPDAHTHPAIPNCTNSIRHVHPNGRSAHSHRYSCRKPAVQRPIQRPVQRPIQRPVQRPIQRPVMPAMPVMPKVKAKGTYRGPIQIDGVMQQYQN